MSSFKDLLSRASTINEAKISPYATAHPSFGAITSKMRAGGLSSAPLDTIKFIREVLYFLDIINDEELNVVKRAAGFTGKKQAMLGILKAKQQEINSKSQEIADRVSSTLDDFINGVGTNRGREEKYAAQAAAQEIASQMRQTKSGKQMDDALIDIVADESLLVRTAVAKILADIQKNLGEPGFDISEEALSEVIDYSSKINNLAALKSFIQQIANEPGYEKIAAYLSSAVKPISQGTEDEEMQEDAEDDFDLGQSEDYDPGYNELPDRELQAFADELGFIATEPGPNTYNSRMYEIEDLYVSEDGAVYLGKYNNPRFPYFVGYEYGRVSADSPSKLEEPIRRILAGEDPEDEFLTGEDPEDEEYDEVMSGDLEDVYKKINNIVYDTNFYTIMDEEGARPNSPELEQEYNDLVKQAIKLSGGEGPAHKVDPMLHGEYSDFSKSKYGRRDRSPISYNEMIKWLKSNGAQFEDEEFDAAKADIDDDGEVEGWEKGLAKKRGFENVPNEDEETVTESYTSTYITEQVSKDSVRSRKEEKSVSFKERYRPKTSYQLDELRRYGL